MNRRELLTSVTVLAGAALVSEAVAQSGRQITHVDTKTGGPLLQSSVVKMESLQPEGAAPGLGSRIGLLGRSTVALLEADSALDQNEHKAGG
jgi:hypothetical protein